MFIALFIVVLRDKNIWHAVILLKFGDKIFGVVEQPGKNIGLNSADALVMEVWNVGEVLETVLLQVAHVVFGHLAGDNLLVALELHFLFVALRLFPV